MKNSLTTLFLCLYWIPVCLAQEAKTVIPSRKAHVILGSSIGLQWFYQTYRIGSLVAEVPVDEYRHLSLQFSRIYGESVTTYEYADLGLKEGFEVGIAGKFFLHGRFTGRKSGFFVGPDIRYGSRIYNDLAYDPTTSQFSSRTVTFKHTKFLLTWGMQWQLGKHTVLCISAPLGYEAVSGKESINSFINTPPSENSIILLPTLMLGIAL